MLLSVERTVHEHILLKALELLAFDFYSNGDLCTPQPAISARLALFSRLKNKTFEELFWLHECLSVMNELRLVDLTFKAWVEKAFQKVNHQCLCIYKISDDCSVFLLPNSTSKKKARNIKGPSSRSIS